MRKEVPNLTDDCTYDEVKLASCKLADLMTDEMVGYQTGLVLSVTLTACIAVIDKMTEQIKDQLMDSGMDGMMHTLVLSAKLDSIAVEMHQLRVLTAFTLLSKSEARNCIHEVVNQMGVPDELKTHIINLVKGEGKELPDDVNLEELLGKLFPTE